MLNGAKCKSYFQAFNGKLLNRKDDDLVLGRARSDQLEASVAKEIRYCKSDWPLAGFERAY
jgi:hypothetical protein